MTPEPLDTQIDDYLDGRLPIEQRDAFEQALLADPAALDRLVAAASVHRLLQDRYAAESQDGLHTLIDVVGEESADPDSPPVMDFIVEQALAERRKHELEDEANRKLAVQQAEDARNRRYELRRQAEAEAVKRVVVIPKALAWLGLAAVLGLVAWIGWPRAVATPPAQTPTAQHEEDQDVRPVPEPIYVARVVASVDAQWEGLDASGARLELDQLFILREGIAEVTFDDGATVLIEAPATFQPTGPNGMRLVEGRLSAVVPPSGYGFKVVTPQMVVTDLGTEFGVHVTRRRGTLTDVFDGRVVASEPQSGERLDLGAGSAVRLSPGRPQLQPVSADSARFYRSIETFAAAPHVSGQGRWLRSAPPDLSFQAYEGDGLAVVPERGRVEWSSHWTVDEAFGPGPVAGQPVDVYLVHYDAVGSAPAITEDSANREVVLTFDRPVLGVITLSDSLYATDATLGSPGTAYPSRLDILAQGRGLEAEADHYELSDDGKTLRIRMRTGPQADQMRVIVASPN